MNRLRRVLTATTLTTVAFCVLTEPAHAQARGGSAQANTAEPVTIQAFLRDRLQATVTAFEDQASPFGAAADWKNGKKLKPAPVDEAAAEVTRLMALAIAHTDPAKNKDDGALLCELAASARLLRFLGSVEPHVAESAWRVLKPNAALRTRLALSLSERDDAAQVCGVLDALDARSPKQVADPKWAGVVAAVCVVHDVPHARPSIAGDRPRRIDPADVFEHLVRDHGAMVFDPCDMPVEALVYVVDTTVTPEETAWAMKSYAGKKDSGTLYDTIDYDTAAFKDNKEKRIVKTGEYSLMNIKKAGGVCAEQAYFAANVGNVIGVPSAYVYAQSDVVAHAYVGYLRGGSKGLWWDFSEGRYDEYEELTGRIRQPQTGEEISDSELALTASLFADKQQDRDLAVALVDASALLASLTKNAAGNEPGWPAALPSDAPAGLVEQLKAKKPAIAEANTAAQLDLLKDAARACPAMPCVWKRMTTIAQGREMSNAQRGEWTEALMDLCGTRYPDFSLTVLVPIIRGVDDARQQDKLWKWAAQKFGRRHDLRARVLAMQAEALAARGDKAGAYGLLASIIQSPPKEGTVIVDVLRQQERLLALAGDNGKARQSALTSYSGVWKRIGDPGKLSDTAYMQSNYYRVGKRYAELLNECGQKTEADKVREKIRRYLQ